MTNPETVTRAGAFLQSIALPKLLASGDILIRTKRHKCSSWSFVIESGLEVQVLSL